MLRWMAFCVLAICGGCYLRPGAVRNPAPSTEGIAVTLLGQDCEDHSGMKGEPVSRDLGIRVRVDNPTDRTLRVSEQTIRLLVDGDTGGVRFPAVVDVPSHGSTTLTMEFTHHALCEMSQRFVVAWDDAFRLGDRPVALENLTFTP
jgi:hypothetical protein